MTLLTDLDAFYLDHRQCDELEAGVDGPVVWFDCGCGARIAALSPPLRRRHLVPDRHRREEPDERAGRRAGGGGGARAGGPQRRSFSEAGPPAADQPRRLHPHGHRPAPPRGAQRLWEACVRAGDVYRRPYRGLYCVRCERFYTSDELVEGRCPEHDVALEVVKEENCFFRLSRYAHRLEALLDSRALRVLPESRHHEVRAFVARGLSDFSISRSRARARGWGIPVPGEPDQVIYVWFDALTNYVTALG